MQAHLRGGCDAELPQTVFRLRRKPFPGCEGEFGLVMLPKRLWFSKEGLAKYISHLDLNRYFARVFRKAKLPLWYTEGFNPHPFMVFTLPLSLGMTGKRESLDIRLTEEMEKEEILRRLNASLAAGMHFFDVTEPLKKAGETSPMRWLIPFSMTPEEGTPEALEKIMEALLQGAAGHR